MYVYKSYHLWIKLCIFIQYSSECLCIDTNTPVIILPRSLLTTLQGQWNISWIENRDKKQHELLAHHCLGCVSVCVPASEVQPALVAAIQHALRVHQLCEQTSPMWTTHQTKEHWFDYLCLLSYLTDSSEAQQWENNFHTLAQSIPEIACITCLVIISRSLSDRCARLSVRAEWVWGATSCLRADSLAACLWARSCCSLLVTSASPAAEDSGEEAAADRSSAASSANTTRAFPDMSVYEEKEIFFGKLSNPSQQLQMTKLVYLLGWNMLTTEFKSSDASGAWAGAVSEQTHPFIPKVWCLSDVA